MRKNMISKKTKKWQLVVYDYIECFIGIIEIDDYKELKVNKINNY